MDNPSVQRTKTEPGQSSTNREERKINLSSFRNFRTAKCIPFQRTLLFNINIIEKKDRVNVISLSFRFMFLLMQHFEDAF